MMNVKPFLERYVLEVPNRVSQNRIVYIHQGAARVKINFISYELRKGDVLLIPSNYILVIEAYSNDIEPWILEFNYGSMEEKEMVGIETIYFHMEERETKVLEYYFSYLVFLHMKLLLHLIVVEIDFQILICRMHLFFL